MPKDTISNNNISQRAVGPAVPSNNPTKDMYEAFPSPELTNKIVRRAAFAHVLGKWRSRANDNIDWHVQLFASLSTAVRHRKTRFVNRADGDVYEFSSFARASWRIPR